MKKTVASIFLGFSQIANAGNVPNKVIDIPVGLEDLALDTVSIDAAYDADEESEIRFAKDYNDCLEGARSKNDRDHDRCDKNEGGDKCHERADATYEKDREGCERVAHSDNARQTGVAWGDGWNRDGASSSSGGKAKGDGSKESGAGRHSGRR